MYPLNNHGHYAYMNESEDRLRRMFWLLFPLLFGGLAAIHHFADPFDAKRRVSRVVQLCPITTQSPFKLK